MDVSNFNPQEAERLAEQSYAEHRKRNVWWRRKLRHLSRSRKVRSLHRQLKNRAG